MPLAFPRSSCSLRNAYSPWTGRKCCGFTNLNTSSCTKNQPQHCGCQSLTEILWKPLYSRTFHIVWMSCLSLCCIFKWQQYSRYAFSIILQNLEYVMVLVSNTPLFKTGELVAYCNIWLESEAIAGKPIAKAGARLSTNISFVIIIVAATWTWTWTWTCITYFQWVVY